MMSSESQASVQPLAKEQQHQLKAFDASKSDESKSTFVTLLGKRGKKNCDAPLPMPKQKRQRRESNDFESEACTKPDANIIQIKCAPTV